MFVLQVTFATLLVVAISFGAVILVRTDRGKNLATWRAEAADQFTAWLSGCGASQLGFTHESCEIVQESETYGRRNAGWVHSYTLTRFIRSRDGNYFMFKSTPQGPYVKLVAPSIAKVVLKEKYVPVPGA